MLFVILSLISAVFGLVEIGGLDDPSCIPGQYMVRYHVNSTLEDVHKHWSYVKGLGVELIATYNINNHYKGFAAKLSNELAAVMQRDSLVAEMSLDCIYTTYQCSNRQNSAPSWGLSRTSHYGSIDSGLNNHYSYSVTGQGSYAYVLDTGIYINHADIRGRAVWGANYAGGSNNDGNGHGSHCAGTIAGSAHGIAKGATVIAVKVLSDGGSGSISGIVSGINWATTDYTNNKRPNGYGGVISMSLGGTSPGTMRTAIQAAYNAGLPTVVAAGNSNANACGFYPAGFPECITVGATDAQDVRSYFSNFGSCVDLFAPGSGITSIWYDGSTEVLSGTSMACPHVAGEAAVLLSQRAYTPAQLEAALRANAQSGLITNPGSGSPNLLLYNNC